MSPGTLTLRLAEPADLAAVDALMARSFPRLLKADYPPSTLVLAVPRLARANPRLLASGRYVLALDGARLLGAGGYSLRPMQTAAVRHLATDPDALRRGVGRRVLGWVLEAARAEGARRIEAEATRTAVPFYAALGFEARGEAEVALAPGIAFAVVRMARSL
jgi:GNAT superfamily N-acetyltransferase